MWGEKGALPPESSAFVATSLHLSAGKDSEEGRGKYNPPKSNKLGACNDALGHKLERLRSNAANPGVKQDRGRDKTQKKGWRRAEESCSASGRNDGRKKTVLIWPPQVRRMRVAVLPQEGRARGRTLVWE